MTESSAIKVKVSSVPTIVPLQFYLDAALGLVNAYIQTRIPSSISLSSSEERWDTTGVR